MGKSEVGTKWLIHTIVLGNLMCVVARKLSSWRGPDSFLLGQTPVERVEHGMAEIEEGLFIFGGSDRSSGMYAFAALQISEIEHQSFSCS